MTALQIGFARFPKLVAGRAALLALCMAAGLTVLSGVRARADEIDDLRQQVQDLKQQVTLLQNQMPGASAGGVASGGGTIAAQQEVQLQQMQQQMQQLQGQIEQVGIKVDDLADKFGKSQQDTELRLQRLEQGGAAGAAAPQANTAQQNAPTALGQVPAQGAAAMPMQQMGADGSVDASGGGAQPLSGPEGSQLPEPTAPGTLGQLSAAQANNLPQPPAGAADAAAAAAAQVQPAAPGQDPSSIQLPGNTPQEQYDYATGLLQRGAYAESELAFKAFIAQHPRDPLAGNAQYWLGESFYARSDYKNAAISFAEGYQKYPKSAKAPDNLLKLGMSLGQIGQKDNACTAFKQLAKQFPAASPAIKDRAGRAQQRYGCTS
jgi:tol-pal system protein YbgF